MANIVLSLGNQIAFILHVLFCILYVTMLPQSSAIDVTISATATTLLCFTTTSMFLSVCFMLFLYYSH